MFKFKSLVVAAALTLASVAGMAQALPVVPQGTVTLAPGAQSTLNFDNFDVASGGFLGDTAYSFTLQSGSYSFSLLDLSAANFFSGQPASVNSVWLSSSNNGPALYTFNLGKATSDAEVTSYAPSGSFSTSVAGTSTFFLNVTGDLPDTYHGGTLSITNMTAAVPEPATGAMLLAGLGLMGAMVRRRKLQD